MAQYQYFNITKPADFVIHVEINRLSKLNAFVEPMWLELRKVFDTLSTDSSVRSVILSGAGDRAFSAGLDLQTSAESPVLAASTEDPSRKAASIRRYVDDFQDCITSIERCEKPVICVIHGYSFGLAIDIATCADVRICSKDAKFAVKEVDIGLAADIGTLSRLPKVVNSYSWVKDVCLSARIFDAEEAAKVGFVSGVYDGKEQAIEAALKWANLVAEKSPVAVQGTKNILDYSRDHNVQEGLKYTSVWNAAALQTTDTGAAIKASISKTKPTFEKL